MYNLLQRQNWSRGKERKTSSWRKIVALSERNWPKTRARKRNWTKIQTLRRRKHAQNEIGTRRARRQNETKKVAGNRRRGQLEKTTNLKRRRRRVQTQTIIEKKARRRSSSEKQTKISTSLPTGPKVPQVHTQRRTWPDDGKYHRGLETGWQVHHRCARRWDLGWSRQDVIEEE